MGFDRERAMGQGGLRTNSASVSKEVRKENEVVATAEVVVPS